MSQKPSGYFLTRAVEERQMALNAEHPQARKIHEALAEEYEKRAHDLLLGGRSRAAQRPAEWA